ncbi:GNAT family N-acetyltransferase [Blastococcus aurantiacus]|nr:GNAT family N-acetyltransferase [Blastococcus aurantiacus]
MTGAVLSVPPAAADDVRRLASSGLDPLLEKVPELVGESDRSTYRAVFRWTTDPADLPEPGEWVLADTPGLPAWLRPFGGHVLVAADPDGTHLAGVGVKRHDLAGHELAVVTAPPARGRGLARALVAQAARRLLRTGALPTYMHDPANTASARVAEAAGFQDRGWTAFGLGERPPEPTGDQGTP